MIYPFRDNIILESTRNEHLPISEIAVSPPHCVRCWDNNRPWQRSILEWKNSSDPFDVELFLTELKIKMSACWNWYRVFSLTWSASMQIYWNKRKRKEFNSHRTGLGHQHGSRFNVLGHQYGRRDVMWKHSIENTFFVSLASSVMLQIRWLCSLGTRRTKKRQVLFILILF